MRRATIVLAVLLTGIGIATATTWYATSSTVNINAASLWVPTSTGNCTGSGTALTWGSQADGDVFNANGCTALAVNGDPGGASVHVTLTNDTTNGGGFTYNTSVNATLHADVTSTKVTALVVTGSTGGLTIIGNITGGNATTAYGVTGSQTLVTVHVTGNVTGGSAGSTIGYYMVGNNPFTITGNVTAGSATGAHGLSMGGSPATVTGNCVGSDTSAAAGCNSAAAGTLTIVGSVISGKVYSGAAGKLLFTPGATNYLCMPKDASYAIGTEDCTHTGGGSGLSSHAIEMPTNPGISNVLLGVAYGSFTGTYAASGGVCTTGSW